jgi:hypothetical protein
LLDKNKNDIEEALNAFLRAPQRVETVVVYVSCHGLQTTSGAFYLAAANTDIDAIPATALEARWLTDRLDECRARRQVVILDSCFSGAFIGAKGDGRSGLQDWLNAGPGDGFRAGQGRAVLTASRATQRSYESEGPAADGALVRSVFSRALIEGLTTGQADADRGWPHLGHGGLRLRVRAGVQGSREQQNPQIMYHGEGRIYLVRSPRRRLADPVELLKDSRPEVRIEAVNRMAGWLGDSDQDRARTARAALTETAADDIAQVSQVARAHLARLAARPEQSATTEVPDAEAVAAVEAVPATTEAGVAEAGAAEAGVAEAGAAEAGSAPRAGNPPAGGCAWPRWSRSSPRPRRSRSSAS